MKKSSQRKVQPLGCSVPECSVSKPLSLVLRVSQLAGVGPLTFRREGSGWTVRVSKILSNLAYIGAAIINLATLAGLTLGLVAGLTDDPEETAVPRDSPTRTFTWLCDLAVVMLTASVAAYGAPKRLGKTILCLRRIQKINKAGLNKQSVDFKDTIACALWLLAVVSIITVDYLEFSWATGYEPEVLSIAVYCYAYFLMFVLEMQFVFSAFEVAKSMGVVCNLIQDLSQLLDAQYTSLDVMTLSYPTKLIPMKSVNSMNDNLTMMNVDPESICGSIRRLASMYEESCDVVRQLDDCHGAGVLLVLLSNFLHLTISLFEMIQPYDKLKDRLYRKVVLLFRCGLQFFSTLAVMEPSHRTQLEDSRVRLFVSRMLLRCPDGVIFKELEKFSRYLLTNQAIYCPLGVCTLARSLVASIIGSVVTYMVIIIQFQLAGQEKISTVSEVNILVSGEREDH